MADTTGTVTTQDGLTLRTATWQPEGDPHRGMLIVHGLGEHLGRWEHVGRFFADRGYEVAAFDLRGHGESGVGVGGLGAFFFGNGGGPVVALPVDQVIGQLAEQVPH